jgi:hypothetical protein
VWSYGYETQDDETVLPGCLLVPDDGAEHSGLEAQRINRAIELLEQGQPIYYTGSHSGTAGTYEQGMRDAQTYADYISYDMEHAPYDIKGCATNRGCSPAGHPRGRALPALRREKTLAKYLHMS